MIFKQSSYILNSASQISTTSVEKSLTQRHSKSCRKPTVKGEVLFKMQWIQHPYSKDKNCQRTSKNAI